MLGAQKVEVHADERAARDGLLAEGSLLLQRFPAVWRTDAMEAHLAGVLGADFSHFPKPDAIVVSLGRGGALFSRMYCRSR